MKPAPTAYACALALLLLATPAHAAPRWEISPEKSRIDFTARYGKDPITGTFTGFTADIRFAPDALETSAIDVTIPIRGLTTEDDDAAEYLPQKAWFHAEMFPDARFVSHAITHLGAQRYLAKGTLSIKKIEKPLELAFTLQLSPEGDAADVQAQADISRLAYGIGEGEWASTDILKDTVALTITLHAVQAPDAD